MEKKFHFSHPFLESFKETIDLLSEQLNKLNTLEKGFTNEMGVYNCSYMMRYITPNDIADYISNLHKGMTNHLISANPHDLEMFAAESARRIMKNHDCVPFDDPGIMGNNFIDDKNTTIQDMLVIHANYVHNNIVCTPFEQKERYAKLKNGDLKTINNLHYVANMKKIVDSIPELVESMDNSGIYTAVPVIGKSFRMAIEEFIMFATTLNAITISHMVDYAIPSATFATKATEPTTEENGDTKPFNEYVTECCLLKTNRMTIENRLPFNCNLRNVVLQDTTPTFCDTRDAVKFILNDSRSPIHGLLVKYTNERRCDYGGAEMIRQAFLTPHRGYAEPPRRKSDVHEKAERRTGFHTDEGWFDKIVYGSQELDSNYREDNPGNNHTHPIAYDIRTIYRMFSCHHNDNEHLANNIVKVANIICSLIVSYNSDPYEMFWDNFRDILAVLAEILTKDILTLYHNNNNVLICRDDMNDTMIPGYMYCETFIVEADGDAQPATSSGDTKSATSPGTSTNQNNNGKTVVKNNTEGMKQSNIAQKTADKILQIVRKFIEYIRNTISQIFPKFNAAHAAEQKWIASHKDLNDKIEKALDGKDEKGIKFSITIENYPNYALPVEAITTLNENIGKVVTNLTSIETAKKYLNEKGGIDGFKKEIIFPEVAKANPSSAEDLKNFTRNYLLYGKTQAPAQEGPTQMTSEKWKSLLENINGDSFTKALKIYTTDITQMMTKLTDATRKILEEEKKLETQKPEEAKDNGKIGEQLFNAVTEVSKNCYTAALGTLTKEFYGRSYNCYRDIVAEYQRTQTNGVEQQQNSENKTEEKPAEQQTESKQDQSAQNNNQTQMADVKANADNITMPGI